MSRIFSNLHILGLAETWRRGAWVELAEFKESYGYEILVVRPLRALVLGAPVRDAMINTWLDAVQEIELLLRGERVIEFDYLPWGAKEGRGLNFAVLLDDPPLTFEGDITKLPEKYWIKKPACDLTKIFRVLAAFDRPVMMGYMIWFN